MAIREIKAGDRVEGVFILDNAEIKEGSTGPYLIFTLRDRTGQMRGVLWQGAQEAFDSIKGRDFARVEGVASEYRGSLNLKLSGIVPLEPDEVDMGGLLEAVPGGVEKWHSRLIACLQLNGGFQICELTTIEITSRWRNDPLTPKGLGTPRRDASARPSLAIA